MRAGLPVRVAWLGGSITQWAAPGQDRCYRVLVDRWLAGQCADGAVYRGINAARGGTNSILGAARFDGDVAVHRPHAVFVEFCVNDCGADPDEVVEAMAGIVAKARAIGSEACFVYTAAQPDLEDVGRGLLPPTVARHEEVAARYEVPAVFAGVQLALDVLAGHVQWEDVMLDGCHPAPAGHAHYAATLTAALPRLLLGLRILDDEPT